MAAFHPISDRGLVLAKVEKARDEEIPHRPQFHLGSWIVTKRSTSKPPQFLSIAVWASDSATIDRCGGPESKMDAKIVVGKIALSAADFGDFL